MTDTLVRMGAPLHADGPWLRTKIFYTEKANGHAVRQKVVVAKPVAGGGYELLSYEMDVRTQKIGEPKLLGSYTESEAIEALAGIESSAVRRRVQEPSRGKLYLFLNDKEKFPKGTQRVRPASLPDGDAARLNAVIGRGLQSFHL